MAFDVILGTDNSQIWNGYENGSGNGKLQKLGGNGSGTLTIPRISAA